MSEGILRRFHKEQERPGSDGIYWHDRMQSWIVFPSEMAGELLRSPHVLVCPVGEGLRARAARSGIAIPNLLTALERAPLANNNEAHRTTRKALAAALLPAILPAVQAFAKAAAELLHNLCVENTTADLVTGLLVPAMNAALLEIGTSQIDPSEFTIVSPPQVFSLGQKLSGARLQTLEAQVTRAQRCGTTAALPMALFAADPTLSSLAETLIEQLHSNQGKRLSDIAWPARLTRTGLPFAERQAAEDFEIAGRLIRKGERISIYLGAFQEEGTLHFGAGAHACLGKALAEQIWAAFVDALRARPERFEVTGVNYREVDFAFVMPINIFVRISS